MNKENLVEKIAEKFSFTKKQALEVVNFVFDQIVENLKKGEDVSISGFGTFKVKVRKARTAINPRTGEKVEVPAKKVAKFTPSKNLKDAIK
jgi:DNA-binding protein HU-beta